MCSILEFLDLASLRVGIPTEHGFQPLKLDILHRRTGLHPRRFERAIQSLTAAGILVVSKQHKLRVSSSSLSNRTQWLFFPSVRRINKVFFQVLGYGNRLIEEMKAASARLSRKAKELGITLARMTKFQLQKAAENYAAAKERRRQQSLKAKQKSQTTVQAEIVKVLTNFGGFSMTEAQAYATSLHAQNAEYPRPPEYKL
jgi:hypothetical protein